MPTQQKRTAPFLRRIQHEFTPPAARNHAVEEKVYSLFQPDVLLPTQYLATTTSKTYREPEKKLMLAVLEDAIWCFQNGLLARDNKKKRGLSSEAEEWIMEEEGDQLFSFNEICELLTLNPKYIRKHLLRWKADALRGRIAAEMHRMSRSGRTRKRAALAAEKHHRSHYRASLTH
ncbi:MAG TPA: hypothetical protein VGL11_06100 [Candidatus Binatia bacterium]|jgi:hypothetical protein